MDCLVHQTHDFGAMIDSEFERKWDACEDMRLAQTYTLKP